MKNHALFLFILLACSFLLPSLNVLAQKEQNHWFWGSLCGFDFSNGEPVRDIQSNMYATGASSCQSDKNGNLLFYTDGFKVYNRNRQIMNTQFDLMAEITSLHPH